MTKLRVQVQHREIEEPALMAGDGTPAAPPGNFILLALPSDATEASQDGVKLRIQTCALERSGDDGDLMIGPTLEECMAWQLEDDGTVLAVQLHGPISAGVAILLDIEWRPQRSAAAAAAAASPTGSKISLVRVCKASMVD
jgi:hypothetical protein